MSFINRIELTLTKTRIMTTIYMNSVCLGFHDRLLDLYYDISRSYNRSRSDLNKKVSVDDILLTVGSV
jgi:hypothetical protein